MDVGNTNSYTLLTATLEALW